MVGATSFFSVDSGRAGDEEPNQSFSFSDIAILYRIKTQLSALEDALLRSGIPYIASGEIPFYEKPEVKEILSYLKIIQNPHSDIDLFGIVNLPPRVIGEQTITLLENYQRTNKLSLWQAMEKSSFIALLSETQKRPVAQFVKQVLKFHEKTGDKDVAEIIDKILNDFGLRSYFKNDKQRLYYWEQLSEQAKKFKGNLTEFLETIALRKETDIYDPTVEKVTLMTLHAAKGLEFPVVFIAGCEEDLIPFRRQGEKIENLDEERRLFYVGMTRAKKQLILLNAKSRFLYGKRNTTRPSRFLNDIELVLKEHRQAEIKEKQKSKIKAGDNAQLKLF